MLSSEPKIGAIDGIMPGTVFESRADLNTAGIHRPMMAGICGTARYGAESIVLSGGYEDDEDFGDEIIYTGQGGNDPQTKRQTGDQYLTQGNLALARSLLLGLPVRVVRGARHNSSFAPPFGYRYDGLFRVEDCWHEQGKSGFRIWRFRLRYIEDSISDRVREPRGNYETEQVGAVPPRQMATIARVVRDTEAARHVKNLHKYVCQICRERLETPSGPYAEAAHIQPLGKPHNGPDILENILCLCPNHHVLLDLGAITIEDDLRVSETTTYLRTIPGHALNVAYLRYHRAHYGNSA